MLLQYSIKNALLPVGIVEANSPDARARFSSTGFLDEGRRALDSELKIDLEGLVVGSPPSFPI